MTRLLSSRWAKVVLFALCLVPAAMLGWHAYRGELGANPIDFVTHKTGDWTIRFLLITLSVTPFRKLFNLPKLARFRRMLGLFAFFYGFLHLMTWAGLDKFFDLHDMWKDVIKRRFITAGMTGFALMIPLAVTSTAGWVRRLGFRRWQALHRLVYFSALAGVIHYYWLVKSDIRMPLLYFTILLALMAYRFIDWFRESRSRRRTAAVPGVSVS